jgi:hypothetical protein
MRRGVRSLTVFSISPLPPHTHSKLPTPLVSSLARPRSSPSPAYQTTNNTAQGITCNVAGVLTNTLTTLYDPTDPSKGAVLTYNGGDIQPGSGNCRISFGIAFQCADFPFPSPVGPYSRNTHFVEQTNICQYTAFAFSQAGCPAGEKGGEEKARRKGVDDESRG